MSRIVFHFVSGGAFFSGTLCLLAALALSTAHPGKVKSAVVRIGGLIGVILVAASGTPLPLWYFIPWELCTIVWVIAFDSRTIGHWKVCWQRLRRLVLFLCLAAIAWELPFHLPPRPPAGRFRSLVVIGDSLSAGDFAKHEHPWPQLLADEHGISVVNLSQNGATAASALAKVSAAAESDGALMLLEIGGNDLLGSTTVERYEENLDRLLHGLTHTGLHVVMLELPLPPFYNGYGEVQRRLARHYAVTLIPKRYFAAAILGHGATLDGLHLSAEGHQEMAGMVWKLLARAFAPNPKEQLALNRGGRGGKNRAADVAGSEFLERQRKSSSVDSCLPFLP